MQIRNRIKELRHVPASDLRPNPKNWRTHPKAQQDALKGILAEVGMADACLARELDDGSLMLIDGHLRAETIGAEVVPVLILDVDEAEADKILATLDPLAAMAESDSEKLSSLIESIDIGNDALQQMMQSSSEQSIFEQDFQDDSEQKENSNPNDSPYTEKTEVPAYEVRAEKPDLGDIFDCSTTEKLIKDIDASSVPEDEKVFLRAAAYRHSVFDFQKAAEFYAHSDPETQRLMEASALVIVDLGEAIKNGWAKLGENLNKAFAEERDDSE
jgi:hypothetical protein